MLGMIINHVKIMGIKMRTTINIDDDIFDELMRITTSKSRAKAVQKAICEYIEIKRKKQLLALRGNLDIANNWQQLRQQEIQKEVGGNG
jgi:Arc/MetJ family transcription regulator